MSKPQETTGAQNGGLTHVPKDQTTEESRPQLMREGNNVASKQDVMLVFSLRRKFERQWEVAAAKKLGPAHPLTERIISSLLTARDSAIAERYQPNREKLARILKPEVETHITYAPDAGRFMNERSDMAGALNRGDARPANDLIRRLINRVDGRDELIYTIKYVEVEEKERVDGTPLPIGWAELKKTVEEAKSNPLMLLNSDATGFSRTQLALLDACTKSLHEYTQEKRGGVRKPESSILPGEGGNLAGISFDERFFQDTEERSDLGEKSLRFADIMSQRAKDELIVRLGRVGDARIPTQRKPDNYADAVARSMIIDVERQMLGWLQQGPEHFIERLSCIKGSAYMAFSRSDANIGKMRRVVELLPTDDDRHVFLESFTYFRYGSEKDREAAIDSTRKMLEIEMGGANRQIILDAVRPVMNLRRDVNKTAAIVDEMVWLTTPERTSINNRIVDAVGVVTQARDNESLAQMLMVGDLVDPVERLPTAAELVIAKEVITTSLNRKPGHEFLMPALRAAVKHSEIFAAANAATLCNPADLIQNLDILDVSLGSTREAGTVLSEPAVTDYMDELRRGEVKRLDKDEQRAQTYVADLMGLMAEDATYIMRVSDACRRIAEKDLNAAQTFLRAYLIEPTDATMVNPATTRKEDATTHDRLFIGSLERITDVDFIRGFTDNTAKIRPLVTVSEAEELSHQDGGPKPVARELALAMCANPQNTEVLASAGDTIRKCLRDRVYLVPEFISILGEARPNLARVYLALMASSDRKGSERLRGVINQERRYLRDDAIAGIDYGSATLQQMQTHLREVAQKQKDEELRERDFAKALQDSRLPEEVVLEYTELSRSVTQLRSARTVNTFRQGTEGLNPQVQTLLLGLAAEISESAAATPDDTLKNREAAATVMTSNEFFGRLSALNDRPYTQQHLIGYLGTKSAEFSRSNAVAVADKAMATGNIRWLAEAERAIDWAGVDEERRGEVLTYIFTAPEAVKPALYAMTAAEILAEKQDPDFKAQMGRFIQENPGLAQTPRYLLVDGKGNVYRLAGASEQNITH